MPGGFGTLDEAFELLTLEQTGKADPVPIVFLEVPDGSYWHAWERFINDEVIKRGLVSPDDEHLYCITDDVEVIAIQKVNESYERLVKSDVKYRFSFDTASLKSE